MKHSLIILSALAMSGCSSFQLGGFCYAPARGGSCMATSAPVAGSYEAAETSAAPAPSTPASAPATKP